MTDKKEEFKSNIEMIVWSIDNLNGFKNNEQKEQFENMLNKLSQKDIIIFCDITARLSDHYSVGVKHRDRLEIIKKLFKFYNPYYNNNNKDYKTLKERILWRCGQVDNNGKVIPANNINFNELIKDIDMFDDEEWEVLIEDIDLNNI